MLVAKDGQVGLSGWLGDEGFILKRFGKLWLEAGRSGQRSEEEGIR